MFISFLPLKDSFYGYRLHGWQGFCFNIWNTSCHSFLAWNVSLKKPTHNLTGVRLNVTFLFFSWCFQNYLTFDNFIIVCLSVGLLCSIYVGWDPLGLVNLDVHFVLQDWEVSAIIALNTLSLFFSPGMHLMWILFLLMVSYNSCGLSLIIFVLFSSCFPDWIISNFLSSGPDSSERLKKSTFKILLDFSIQSLYFSALGFLFWVFWWFQFLCWASHFVHAF